MKLAAPGTEVSGEAVADECFIETGVANSLDEEHSRVVGKKGKIVSGLLKALGDAGREGGVLRS